MKTKKVISSILLILLILNTTLILFLAPFRFYIFNENFYQKEFSNLDIYNKIPDADKRASDLINFFNDKSTLDNQFYTQDEISHLKDVKKLINKTIIFFYSSVFIEILLLTLLYHKSKVRFKKDIRRIFKTSSAVIIIVSLLIYLLSFKFDFLFTRFHRIFFPQGNWQFSADSNLINLFPQSFFYDFFYQTILISAAISLLIFVSILLLSPTKKRKIKQLFSP